MTDADRYEIEDRADGVMVGAACEWLPNGVVRVAVSYADHEFIGEANTEYEARTFAWEQVCGAMEYETRARAMVDVGADSGQMPAGGWWAVLPFGASAREIMCELVNETCDDVDRAIHETVNGSEYTFKPALARQIAADIAEPEDTDRAVSETEYGDDSDAWKCAIAYATLERIA